MKRVGLVEARECGYDNALGHRATRRDSEGGRSSSRNLASGRETQRRDASSSPPGGDTTTRLLHNVPAWLGHLSTPITDFGKGARRRRRRPFAFFSSRSHRLRAKPAPRRCHRGHARWKLARISHCSSERLHCCRAELQSCAQHDFIVATFSLRVENLARNCPRYFMASTHLLNGRRSPARFC